MDLAPSGEPPEPSEEIPSELHAVLEDNGVDPAEFQEFIDEVGGVEAYQDLDEYEDFITTFKRIKAREPNRWEAPAGVEPEVDAEAEATAAAEAKAAEATLQLNTRLEEEGIDPDEFQKFLSESTSLSTVSPDFNPDFFIRTFKDAELTLQLNTRLEEEGIDPDEFQRFLAESGADAAFQATPDFSPDFFIRIFNRSKARGDSF